MPEADVPDSINEIVGTIADLFKQQGRSEVAELLEQSHASFEETNYDNWNGGTYTWALRLEISVARFASIESRLESIEKEISKKLAYFDRMRPNDHFGEVTISPLSRGGATGQQIAPLEDEIQRIWPKGRFRLFLSHLSVHKIEVSKLKNALERYGITAFVAHEDITPSSEWMEEIELGLRSMHALAALITPGFRASPWTDQEIGWALGRGALVLSVRLGADPYGFAGKFQGVSGTLDEPAGLAQAIVDVLIRNTKTHGDMRRAIVSAFCEVSSHSAAQALRRIVVNVPDFTDEEKTLLRKACVENPQVSGAYYLPEAIYKAIGAPKEPTLTEDNDIPF